MNVERTIEFLLEGQAKTEARFASITKLLQEGMRLLVKTDATVAQLAGAQKRTERRVAELADEVGELAIEVRELGKETKRLTNAQKNTDRTLKAFIKGQRNGRNDH